MTEKPGQPSDDKPERSRFVTFWTSLPGVLTGIAAVIAAVVSLVALFGPGRDGHSSIGTPVGSSTVAAAEPPAGSVAPPRPASGAEGSASPQPAGVARGSMELSVNEFADLASDVVTDSRTATSEFFLFHADDYRLVAAIDQTFALTDGAPDRTKCASTLSQRQSRQLSLPTVRGRTVCLSTGGQRVAALTLTALPTVGSPRIAFDYVVWM